MLRRRAELAGRRRALGFTQESLAERLGIDQTTVKRWEQGARTPEPALRSALASALKLTHEQLDDLINYAPLDRVPSSGTASFDGTRSAGDLDLARRAALSMGLGTAAALMVSHHDYRMQSETISIKRLTRQVHAMRPLLYSASGRSVLPLVSELLDASDELLWQARGIDQRHALVAYSELCLMAGRLVFFDVGADGSRDREARCHFREALAAAQAAQDVGLEVAAVGHLAFVTARRSHAARAVEDLRFADRLAEQTDMSGLRAWVAAVESELLARSDTTASLRALDRADEYQASATRPSPASLDWFDYFSDAQLDSFRGYALIEAGRVSEARQALESALAFYTRDRNSKQRSVVLLDLATTHLQVPDRDVHTACTIALKAVDGVEHLGYATVLTRLRAFLRQLDDRTLQAGTHDLLATLQERAIATG